MANWQCHNQRVSHHSPIPNPINPVNPLQAKHLAPLQNGASLFPWDEKQGQRGRQHHGGIRKGVGVLEVAERPSMIVLWTCVYIYIYVHIRECVCVCACMCIDMIYIYISITVLWRASEHLHCTRSLCNFFILWRRGWLRMKMGGSAHPINARDRPPENKIIPSNKQTRSDHLLSAK